MHGAPALPADFTHMPYVNPDAPKGGRLVQGLLGSFDSLNPLIVSGVAVQQVRGYGFERGYVLESLMTRGNDEPFTLYGLLAESVETDNARNYVTFRLNPLARFSDGQKVLADDVLFSFALLRDHGRPNHRQYYSKVLKAEALDPLHGEVRFWRRWRSRTAADPRSDADPAPARHRRREFRGDLDDAADRFRSLSRHRRQTRCERHIHTQSRLLGPRPANQPRVLEFRRDQARLLSRGERRCSKPSSAACTIFVSRPNRCAGMTDMIFRPPALAR